MAAAERLSKLPERGAANPEHELQSWVLYATSCLLSRNGASQHKEPKPTHVDPTDLKTRAEKGRSRRGEAEGCQ